MNLTLSVDHPYERQAHWASPIFISAQLSSHPAIGVAFRVFQIPLIAIVLEGIVL
jgi:hypothetical protein